MRRREVLGATGTGLIAAIAGCGNQYSDRMRATRADDETLVALQSRRVEGTTRRRVVAALVETGGFDSSDAVAASLPRPDDALFIDEPTRYDGAVYDFSRERIGERSYSEYTVELDHRTAASTDGTAVTFAELPAVDRRALAPLFGRRGGTPTESRTPDTVTARDDGQAGPTLRRRRITARYPSDTVGTSRLLEGNITALRINGTRFALDVTAENRDVPAAIYRYGIEDRWTVAEYAERVRATYLVSLDDLSDSERSALETAIGGVYELENDGPGRALLDRLADHEPISKAREGPVTGTPPFPGPYNVTTWLVGYRGKAYFVEYTEKTYDMA